MPFAKISKICDGRTDGRTHTRTDGRTDGQTDISNLRGPGRNKRFAQKYRMSAPIPNLDFHGKSQLGYRCTTTGVELPVSMASLVGLVRSIWVPAAP